MLQVKCFFLKGCVFLWLFSSLALAGNSAGKENENIEFDSSFLKMEGVDLSYFSQSGFVQPGVYPTIIYLNNQFIKYGDIQLGRQIDGKQNICFVEPIIDALNFDYSLLPEAFIASLKQDDRCLELESYLDGASIEFHVGESRLNIFIPQAYMLRQPRGYTDPVLWDEGIPSAYLSYDISAYNSSTSDYRSASAYLSGGINVGSWYFKHKGSSRWSSKDGSDYTNISSYLEKPIPDINSKAMIGLANTEGRLFDSVPLLGAQLRSNPTMLPASRRGYAPQIFGSARSNARVTVSQNDNIIYETTVSPGEFIIDDLYPNGYGGYLDVVVHEADGSQQKFQVPYNSLTNLLRADTYEYSVAIGQYKNDTLRSNPLLLEGTYERGLSNSVTLFGGVQGNQDYLAVKAGIALGTSIGAFSLDVDQAYIQLPGFYDNQEGQSYELKYSKSMTSLGSSISLGAYRYSSEGYMDYQTAMRARDLIQRGSSLAGLNSSKNRFVFTAAQDLPDDWGQLYFSSSFENYWSHADYLRQYQLSYSNNFKSAAWGVSVNRNQDIDSEYQTNYAFNVSMPLSMFDDTHPPQFRASSYHNDNGSHQQQVGFSHSLGEHSEFNYGVNVMRSSETEDVSLDANASYETRITTLSASVSKGDSYSTQSVGLSGSIVGHSGGLTFTPRTGDTFALVEAKGAEGASILGYGGIKVDGNGYAAVPNMRPYAKNEIGVDLTTAAMGVELSSASKRFVPYENAVVLLEFDATVGIPVLIRSSLSGIRIPFAASASDSEGNIVGNVGQNNQIFAQLPSSEGSIIVTWEEGDCSIDYQLSEKQLESQGLIIIEGICK